MKRNKSDFVVRANQRGLPYRVTLTRPASKESAERTAENLRRDMETAIDKYRIFSDITVEQLNPEDLPRFEPLPFVYM